MKMTAKMKVLIVLFILLIVGTLFMAFHVNSMAPDEVMNVIESYCEYKEAGDIESALKFVYFKPENMEHYQLCIENN